MDMGKRRVVGQCFATFVVSMGFASVCTAVLFRSGLLFSGLETGSVVAGTVALCCIAVLLIDAVLSGKGRALPWRVLLPVTILLACSAVCVYSFTLAPRTVRIFFTPASVPKAVHVHRGHVSLFFLCVHFTGPAAEIAESIRLKGLAEVSPEPPEHGNWSAYGSREHWKKERGWWKPMTMPNARFLYKSHQKAGGFDGWWVSGSTQEVYALCAF
jgi:hypothetical protein